MQRIEETTFVCIDCEATGLNLEQDRIIEIALAVFKNGQIEEEYTTLLDPGCPIPSASEKIHLIRNEMVKGQPIFLEVAPQIFSLLERGAVVGHSISFDLELIRKEAERSGLDWQGTPLLIDTLRLARSYGKCPLLSLDALCQHFGIPLECHHRAMSDVRSTISLFQRLVQGFTYLETVQTLLDKPIEMKFMPLGEYRGFAIRQLPLSYLKWATKKKFDLDLHYSLSKELQRRRNDVRN
ncbi:putative quorum-sensing-regulated virulence factor [Candidatus Similichlamydia laticola]|uniref:DNA polymerase III epsilon chain n=1 Tax=Candidatus Similichlamydia laticola TaxID=2170265 RepID=A0A369KB89_9BACT|nr:DUF3820 family protein [Candidatus Similichlamydia laticola]RDB31869.1 DNA polymerase III epsilon chain [Candidatus Similichlamydia laticola]